MLGFNELQAAISHGHRASLASSDTALRVREEQRERPAGVKVQDIRRMTARSALDLHCCHIQATVDHFTFITSQFTNR